VRQEFGEVLPAGRGAFAEQFHAGVLPFARPQDGQALTADPLRKGSIGEAGEKAVVI
jgi:hypothetical protein